MVGRNGRIGLSANLASGIDVGLLMEITYVTVSTVSVRVLRFLSIGGLFAVVGMASVLPRPASASEPTKAEIRRFVPFGAYLAGRHAVAERDAVAAAEFYRAALRSDPKNKDILDRAFLAFLAGGQVDEAAGLAQTHFPGRPAKTELRGSCSGSPRSRKNIIKVRGGSFHSLYGGRLRI